MSDLGVAIVGSGTISEQHARAIHEVQGLTVTAVVDPVPERAHTLADAVEALGMARPAELPSLTEALLPSVDLVSICVPSGLHVALAEEALAAGRHVLIEKPLDVDLDRARRFAALAAGSASVVSVVSQHRFDPSSVRVIDAVRAGDFGRLTSGIASIAWWRDQAYYDSAEWRGTWALDGGGAAMNQGIHTIDLLLWCLGRPVQVFARTALLAHTGIEVEDTLAATIAFESGALGLVHATTAAFPGVSARLSIFGDGGSAIIENDALTYFGSSAVEGVPNPAGGAGTAHAAQYADVVAAITEGRAPGVTVDDALLALATVNALYESAVTGLPVTLG